MGYSFSEDTGNGVKVTFPFSFSGPDNGYFDATHIKVEVDGIETAYTLTGPTQVTLATAPISGAKVRVLRKPPIDAPYTDFLRGNSFGKANINRSFQQQLYLTHRYMDGFKEDGTYEKQNLVMGTIYRITALADGIDPQDAVSLQQLQDAVIGDLTLNTVYNPREDYMKYLSDYDNNIAVALDAIGSNISMLTIDVRPDTLVANVTVPSTLHLRWNAGCQLQGAYDITIGGYFTAGDYQVFDGCNVIFTGKTDKASPEWWKANENPGTTDMTLALQACVDSIGNTAPIVLSAPTASGSISLGLGGGIIQGLVSHSYYISGAIPRGRYNLVCLLGDSSGSTLLYGEGQSKSTWTIRDININMRGSTATAIQNEVQTNGGIRFNIRHVNVDECGGDGIIINTGANTTRIEDSYVSATAGFIVDGDFVLSAYVQDSCGFKIVCSDCVIRGNEVKGGFWYGLYISSSQSIVSDNFFDQCIVGCYIYFGDSCKFIGNRFHYNRGIGMEFLGGRATIVGNTFGSNNTSRLAAYAEYDGVGLLLAGSKYSIISSNLFVSQEYGIKFISSLDCSFNGNSEYDISGSIYNLDEVITTGETNHGWDATYGDFCIFNNEIRASLSSNNNGHMFDGPVTFNSGAMLKLFESSIVSDMTLNAGDGTFLKIEATDSDGHNITLGTDYSLARYTGCSFIVHNKGATYTFEFGGFVVPVDATYSFINAGGQIIKKIS